MKPWSHNELHGVTWLTSKLHFLLRSRLTLTYFLSDIRLVPKSWGVLAIWWPVLSVMFWTRLSPADWLLAAMMSSMLTSSSIADLRFLAWLRDYFNIPSSRKRAIGRLRVMRFFLFIARPGYLPRRENLKQRSKHGQSAKNMYTHS